MLYIAVITVYYCIVEFSLYFNLFAFKILCLYPNCQVLELEQQHSNALQELSKSYSIEAEELVKQHQLQLQVCVCKIVVHCGGEKGMYCSHIGIEKICGLCFRS